jgi:Tol biopolymer transport system component
MTRLAITVIGLLTVAFTVVAVSPAGATVPSENGFIVFASDRDGDMEIYTIRSDGTGLTRLTHRKGADLWPSWSPDGRQIVFARNWHPYWGIVVMNADGSDQRVIASGRESQFMGEPAWSPDGTTIAFHGSGGIFLMSEDGSNQRRLTSSHLDWGPEWSPDGLRVAFGKHSTDTTVGGVMIIDIDGSNEVRLAQDDGQPSWAPHGRMIAAWSETSHVAKSNVWLHTVDGSGAPVPLVENSTSDSFGENPAWSPDGSLFVLQDGSGGLALWDIDGSASTPLTTGNADGGLHGDLWPEWQPVNPYPMGLVDPASGQWHLRDATGKVASFYYGNPGDHPIMGDWNCDGIDNPGLYRQSDGFLYLRNSNTQGNANIRFFFGNPDDGPLAGDFNGDGCDTVSIYRPSQSKVFIINRLGSADKGLGAADTDYYFGNPGDTPFTGDFDGDGVDTIGLYRQTTGLVYFRNTHTQGNADDEFFFGNPADRFVAGDWNHDGTDTPAVYRPDNTTHYFRFTNTQGNADARYIWGQRDWLPVTGNYN